MEVLIKQYYQILCKEYPDWMSPYLDIPCMVRLKGIGLFCGTDWTNLYHHKFFYSRYDHSVAVALIIWHFTYDKKQTLAGLLHDVSSPIFSHVIDFKNKDYLEQSTTESLNEKMLKEDPQLLKLLQQDNILFSEISNYHQYPIADNDMPRLSADRLEYMFSTGMIMDDIWTLDRIVECYNSITILKNEEGIKELGFMDKTLASEYCIKCVEVGKLYLTNKNKLALQLLADMIKMAIALQVIKEKDIYVLTEKEVCKKFDSITDETFVQYWNAFKNSSTVKESDVPMGDYTISLEVKKRYINPLCNGKRITTICNDAKQAVFSLRSLKTLKHVGIYFQK